MKKVRVTKQIIKEIREKKITPHAGKELSIIVPYLDLTTEEGMATALEDKLPVVLAEDNGKHFMVSPERYDRIKNQGKPKAKTKAAIKQKQTLKHQVPRKSVPAVPAFAVPAPTTIWDKEELFIDTFPKLKKQFLTAKATIDKQGCTGCAANAQKAVIIKAAFDCQQKKPVDIPIELMHLMDPQYTHIAAQTEAPDAPAGSIKQGPVVLAPKQHSHKSTGYRPTCLDCVRKHLAQSIILLQEAENPEYKAQLWLGIGHLAEAESESMSSYPDLSNTIRDHRLAIMADHKYKPDLTAMFTVIDVTETKNG